MERFLVKQGMHLGYIRDFIRPGQVIEWTEDTGRMTVDGRDVKRGHDEAIDTFAAMRALQTLCERCPGNPPIVKLGDVPDEAALGAKLKTDTLCVVPILGCLTLAEGFINDTTKRLIGLGTKDDWRTVNKRQKEFMDKFGASRSEIIEKVSPKELEGKADSDTRVINAWLKEKGFDIQLDVIDELGAFAVASILNLLVKWLKEGKESTITSKRDGRSYSGVYLKEGVWVGRDLDVHHFPVVIVDTKSGDVVKMAVVDSVPEGDFGIHELTRRLDGVKSPHNLRGVVFPMIDLDVQPNIHWIERMKLPMPKPGWHIKQALQQTKFRMNEKGARVESAVAMKLRPKGASAEPEPCVIDRPFLLWIERPRMKLPFFAAVLCEDVWKKPKEL